jgi:hypothetical protein
MFTQRVIISVKMMTINIVTLVLTTVRLIWRGGRDNDSKDNIGSNDKTSHVEEALGHLTSLIVIAGITGVIVWYEELPYPTHILCNVSLSDADNLDSHLQHIALYSFTLGLTIALIQFGIYRATGWCVDITERIDKGLDRLVALLEAGVGFVIGNDML